MSVVKKDFLKPIFAIAFIFMLSFSVTLWAQDESSTDNHPVTFDENATAESLGLEPFEYKPSFSPDFFPLYPWDHLYDWASRYQTMEDALSGIADCGFNMAGFVYPEHVSLCEKNNLACIVSIKLNAEKLKTISDEEMEQIVVEAIESTKDNEYVLGYYLMDEPGSYYFAGLGKAVAAIKKHAPGKLAYINLFPGYASTIGADAVSQLGTHSFTEYLERFVQEVKPQFISYDNYMTEYSDDMHNKERAAQYYNDLLEIRRIALKYDLPFWNITGCTRIQETSSPPSVSRLAFQAYSTLGAGGKGLGWFTYYPLSWVYAPMNEKGNRTVIWQYLRDVNEQTKTLGLLMKDYVSTGVYFTDPTPTPNLPTLPGKIVQSVEQTASMRNAIPEIPPIMVGEFQTNDNETSAVMLVNCDLDHPAKVKLNLVADYQSIQIVSPIDGTLFDYDRDYGYWLLPGHGALFLLK